MADWWDNYKRKNNLDKDEKKRQETTAAKREVSSTWWDDYKKTNPQFSEKGAVDSHAAYLERKRAFATGQDRLSENHKKDATADYVYKVTDKIFGALGEKEIEAQGRALDRTTKRYARDLPLYQELLMRTAQSPELYNRSYEQYLGSYNDLSGKNNLYNASWKKAEEDRLKKLLQTDAAAYYGETKSLEEIESELARLKAGGSTTHISASGATHGGAGGKIDDPAITREEKIAQLERAAAYRKEIDEYQAKFARVSEIENQVRSAADYEELRAEPNSFKEFYSRNISKKPETLLQYLTYEKRPDNDWAQMVAQKYWQMTDDQKAVFHYLWAKEDAEGAAVNGLRPSVQYMNTIPGLHEKYLQRQAEDAYLPKESDSSLEKGRKVLRYLTDSLGEGTTMAIEQGADALDNIGRSTPRFSNYDTNSLLPIAMQRAGDGVGGEIYKTLGQAGQSVGRMIPSMAMGNYVGWLATVNPTAVAALGKVTHGAITAERAVKGAQNTVFYLTTKGSAMAEGREKGLSGTELEIYSNLCAISEVGLQNAIGGIAQFGGVSEKQLMSRIAQIDNVLLRTAARFGVQYGGELLEEELQNWMEPGFVTILTGDEYQAPTALEMLETALSTLFMVGSMNAGDTAQYYDSSKVRRNLQIIADDYRKLGGEYEKAAQKLDAYIQAVDANPVARYVREDILDAMDIMRDAESRMEQLGITPEDIRDTIAPQDGTIEETNAERPKQEASGDDRLGADRNDEAAGTENAESLTARDGEPVPYGAQADSSTAWDGKPVQHGAQNDSEGTRVVYEQTKEETAEQARGLSDGELAAMADSVERNLAETRDSADPSEVAVMEGQRDALRQEISAREAVNRNGERMEAAARATEVPGVDWRDGSELETDVPSSVTAEAVTPSPQGEGFGGRQSAVPTETGGRIATASGLAMTENETGGQIARTADGGTMTASTDVPGVDYDDGSQYGAGGQIARATGVNDGRQAARTAEQGGLSNERQAGEGADRGETGRAGTAGQVSLSAGERGGNGRGRAWGVSEETRRKGGEKGTASVIKKRQDASQDNEVTSPAEFGVPFGSEEATCRIYSEATWDEEAQTGVEFAYNNGVRKVTLLLGLMQVEVDGETVSVNGAINKDTGELFIRADSTKESISEIIEHEIAHLKANAAKVRAFMEAVKSRYKEAAWQTMYSAYEQKYADVTNDYAGMSEAEKELYIWEEICCDAAASVNKFGTKAEAYHVEATQALDSELRSDETVGPGYRFEGGRYSSRENAAAMDRTNGPGQRFSIQDVQGQNNDYPDCVVLDTNLFDGVKPRDWGAVLQNYVYNNFADKELAIYDENWYTETVKIARYQDRVTKTGAKNSHRVIDDLARNQGDNIKNLAVAHIPELLVVSTYDKGSLDNNHQWLDQNGWTYRKAYICDKTGKIYEATLNIAEGRDRRILYDISLIKEIDRRTAGGVVPSTVTGRGSPTSRSSSKKILPDPNVPVKHFSSDEQIARIDADYQKAVDSGDMRTAQRMVDEAAKRAGYTIKAYHGTRAGEFYVFDKSRAGQNYGGFNVSGGGFDFTTNEFFARLWGQKAKGSGEVRVMPVYLKADKTFYAYEATPAEMRSELPDDIQIMDKETGEVFTGEEAKDMAMRRGAAFQDAMGENGINFIDTLHKFGYDSYAMKQGDENIAVYDEEQIKSAETVTRDTKGEVVPLSERFRTDRTGTEEWKNRDIRFSAADEEDVPGPEYDDGSQYEDSGRQSAVPTETEEDVRGVDWLDGSELEETRDADSSTSLRSDQNDNGEAGSSGIELNGKELSARTELRTALMDIFHVAPGNRTRMTAEINRLADKAIEARRNKGTRAAEISTEDRKALYRLLYDTGLQAAQADEYYQQIRERLKGVHIYVDAQTRADFGDDYNDFRRRCWANNIYLTADTRHTGADVINAELAEDFPGAADANELDPRAMLENILDLAEKGKTEKLTNDEALRRQQSETGEASVDQMKAMRWKADRAVDDFLFSLGTDWEGMFSGGKNGLTQKKAERLEQLSGGKTVTDRAAWINLVGTYGERTLRDAGFTPAAREQTKQETGGKLNTEELLGTLDPSKDGKDYGTSALQKLGVTVEGSVGDFSMVQQMIATDKSAKSVQRGIRKAEKRLNANAKEKAFASGIAAGIYTQEDIPGSFDREKILELADYYAAERATTNHLIRDRRAQIKQDLDMRMAELFKDSDQYKSPSMVVLNERTPERNMRRIFGDKLGEEINRTLFYPTQHNEAERLRFINRMHDAVRIFQDSSGKKTGLTVEERALAQMLLEGQSPEELAAGAEIAETVEMANRVQKALQAGKIDQTRVNNAVETYRALYNQMYDAINDFLVAHGYEPIGFRKDYAPHMQTEETQNLLQKAFRHLGVNAGVTELPASIAGLTADYKPSKRWNPHFLERTGNSTAYDIAQGFEEYVEYLSDIFYHMDDTMRVRQAAKYFRETYAPENIKAEIERAKAMEKASTEEKLEILRDAKEVSKDSVLSEADVNEAFDKYLEALYERVDKTTRHSNLTMWLDNYANLLAGKQSMADRGQEYSMGRKAANWANRMVRGFAQSKVAGNLSSVLNQGAQIPMIYSELGTRWTAAAMRDIVSGKLRKAAWWQQSDFLTGKHGIDYLVSTPGEMVMTAMFKPAELMDGMVSTLAVRGKYLEQIKAGKSHEEAMRAADRFGTEIMGSRMKGARPNAYAGKGILNQMVHIFQVEAVNSWEHLTQDLPRDFREITKTKGKGKAALALSGVIVKMLLAAFVLNRWDDELYGGTPAPFDLIGLTSNFIASGEGLSTNEWIRTIIDNGLEKLTGDRIFGTDADEIGDEDFNWNQATEDTLYNVLNDVPFIRNISGIMGWGDKSIPMPDLFNKGKNVVESIAEHGAFSPETGKALLQAGTEIIPGGNQINKTVQGLEALLRGGDFSGYGEKEKLKYPLDESVISAIKALAFGKYATGESDSYYASGDSMLSQKQTVLWRDLVSSGIKRQDAYKAIQDFRDLSNENKDVESWELSAMKRSFIAELPWNDDQKAAAFSTLISDSRADDMQAFADAGMSFSDFVDVYNEYARIDNEVDGKASQKATEFSQWLNRRGFTQEQKDTVNECFKYWNFVPASPGKYDSFVEAGLADDDAMEINNILAGLQPEAGKDQVSNLQKYQAIVKAGLNENDQMLALRSVMPEGEYARLEIGNDLGVSPTNYITLKTIMPDFDEDRNGGYTQEEVKNAVDSMSGLTKKQRAVLWQLANKSWKASNNPYDPDVGQRVYDALHAG